MAEFEFAGMTFRGGKMMIILTALSTAGGGLWGGFEFYKDYMDMKEIIQSIDIDEIQAANELQLQKLNDAIAFTTAIREDLASDVARAENAVRVSGRRGPLVAGSRCGACWVSRRSGPRGACRAPA